MSDETVRLKLPQLVSLQELNAVTWNEALEQIDALTDLCLLGVFVDNPPSAAQDGDAYLTGGAPTGAWSGYPYKIASCRDGAWRFYMPFDGLRAFVAATGAVVVYRDGLWSDLSSAISSSEVSCASADSCDLGAAGALFVRITGATTIRSFGSAACRLRYVRFAGALTLTHSASSLCLLGGASRVTAAGDCGVYASDASGNWRELSYVRAARDPGDYATRSGTETLTGKTLSAPVISGGTIDNAVVGGSAPAAGRFTTLGVGITTALATLHAHRYGTPGAPQMRLSYGTGANADTNYHVDFCAPNPTDNGLTLTSTGCYYSWKNGTVEILKAERGILNVKYDDNNYTQVRYDGFVMGGGDFVVSTSSGGAATERLRISINNGNTTTGTVVPRAANAFNLGSASYYWANGYIQNAWTVVSDETLKDEIAGLGGAELAVAKEIAPLVSLYKMKSAIAEKGSARARKHCGWIAQRIEAVFAAHGLDPFAYGCVGCDRVSETADGHPETHGAQKTVHNLRVDEVTAFALAGLAARVAALEAGQSHGE